MPRTRDLEASLAALTDLRSGPMSDSALEQLRKALASKTNLLVARAAQIVGESEIEGFEADLAQAFERLLASPSKADKGCLAKISVAEALYRLGYGQESLFLQGISHIQLDPVYGGKEDTAAKLRVMCAMGLVRMNYPQAMIELARLLADSELDARIGAVRAVAYARQDSGVPLLQFKVLVGDEDSRVLYECFGALLRLSPESSLAFVGGFLDDQDVTVCEAAAIALGESRQEEAFDFLKVAWEKTLDHAVRSAELCAIAMLRHEQAIDFLLSLVADESPAITRSAIAALEMYRRDEKIWLRIEQIVTARGDINLSQIVGDSSH